MNKYLHKYEHCWKMAAALSLSVSCCLRSMRYENQITMLNVNIFYRAFTSNWIFFSPLSFDCFALTLLALCLPLNLAIFFILNSGESSSECFGSVLGYRRWFLEFCRDIGLDFEEWTILSGSNESSQETLLACIVWAFDDELSCLMKFSANSTPNGSQIQKWF